MFKNMFEKALKYRESQTFLQYVLDYENEQKRAWNTMVETTF